MYPMKLVFSCTYFIVILKRFFFECWSVSAVVIIVPLNYSHVYMGYVLLIIYQLVPQSCVNTFMC